MTRYQSLAEDLPRLAVDAFALANRHCGSCRDYHSVWPYLRLSRSVAGLDPSRAGLMPHLRPIFAGESCRVLIAGVADTGTLAFIANAANGRRCEITVVDRCRTPLEVCRSFAERWSLPVETRQQELAAIADHGRFDLVFGHMILCFIPPEEKLEVFGRLARSLRPGGRLIFIHRSRRRSASHSLENELAYSRWLMEAIIGTGVALPEPKEAFLRRLQAYARDRARRDDNVTDADSAKTMIEAAGLEIEEQSPLAVTMNRPSERTVFLQLVVARRGGAR